MGTSKIIDNTKVNWYDGDVNRLSYQMIFQDADLSDPPQEEAEPEVEIDISELLEERDQEWLEKTEQVKQEYFQKGYEEGFEKGLEEARAEIDAKLEILAQALQAGQQKWDEQQQLLRPGLTELAFSMAESILGIPVENPAINDELDQKLGRILQKIDNETRPVLLISETDHEIISKVVSEYAPNSTIVIRSDKQCNPGEFVLETTEETLVYKFNEMLQDFKSTLNLPSWKA